MELFDFTIYRMFYGIPQINRQRIIWIHQTNQAVHQIRNVLERSGLFPTSINLKN